MRYSSVFFARNGTISTGEATTRASVMTQDASAISITATLTTGRDIASRGEIRLNAVPYLHFGILINILVMTSLVGSMVLTPTFLGSSLIFCILAPFSSTISQEASNAVIGTTESAAG